MHRLCKFLVLVLISGGTDGASRRKTRTIPGVDKPLSARALTEQSRGASGSSAVNGVQGQYVDMGAAGFAELALKLDMRQFLATLEMIPVLSQAVTNMETKLDSIIANSRGDQLAGFETQIIKLNKMLEGRLSKEESRIDSLVTIVQNLEKHSVELDRKLDHLGEGVKNVGQVFNSGVGGGCDEASLNDQVDVVLKTQTQIGTALEKSIVSLNKNLGILQDNMQKSFETLEGQLLVLEKTLKPGYLCPMSHGSKRRETIIMARLSNFEQKLAETTQNIFSWLPQIVANKDETVQCFKLLAQNDQEIRSDIESMKQQLATDKEDMKIFFADNQKSLVAFRKVVTETTQVVQSSAAAAISASRSLRCAANQNQKLDLVD